MSVPWAFERSPFRCPRDGKALAMDLGQNADGGWTEERHFCVSCDYVQVGTRADKTLTVLTVAQVVARKQAHLDRTFVWSTEDGVFRAEWCHQRPAEACDLGLMLKSWQVPELEPMAYRSQGWVLLGMEVTWL
jgi:hypothetical protein